MKVNESKVDWTGETDQHQVAVRFTFSTELHLRRTHESLTRYNGDIMGISFANAFQCYITNNTCTGDGMGYIYSQQMPTMSHLNHGTCRGNYPKRVLTFRFVNSWKLSKAYVNLLRPSKYPYIWVQVPSHCVYIHHIFSNLKCLGQVCQKRHMTRPLKNHLIGSEYLDMFCFVVDSCFFMICVCYDRYNTMILSFRIQPRPAHGG